MGILMAVRFLSILSSVLLASSLLAVASPKNPNIVYIMSDELAYFELSHMGNPYIKTPNIDRFAQEGIRFTSALAGAPVCAPLRCNLMTGKHAGHASVRANDGGTPLRAGEPTIASILKEIGYATGGFGKIYKTTSNAHTLTGDGLGIIFRKGLPLEDMEFHQFHPTGLAGLGILISEAVRGEGGVLVDAMGQSPVSHLPQGDLAPRDQVSRALVHTMQAQRTSQMWLDFSPIQRERAEARFPTILDRCGEFGLNPLERPIPVAPAAHYWMGGVATDLQAATNLPGLYAVGEVACTGLHGANRLASNSLMECLVFAHRMADIQLQPLSAGNTPISSQSCSTPLDFEETTTGLMDRIEQLRQLCWREAGVDRSARGMRHALQQIKHSQHSLESQPLLLKLQSLETDAALELVDGSRRDLNLLLDVQHRLLTSGLMLEACLFRRESRGGHFRTDAPAALPHWRQHSRQSRGEGIRTRAVRP